MMPNEIFLLAAWLLIAELRRRSAEYDEIPASILDFLEAHRR
jgi:hypothetical protein